MAGMGTRMRPHTLTTPKPLLKIAGKSIVQRLVEDIVNVTNADVDEIAFVIGNFGKEVEENLCNIAKNIGAQPKIYYQEQALGTGHAIFCAEKSLKGNTVVAFADTLFEASFKLDLEQDGIIWTKEVEDPSQFGVVKFGDDNFISDFVEKPKQFVSNQAIIGIYYFKSGEDLRTELAYLIDNDINVKGEYQLTDALENLKNKGTKFKSQTVDKWLDCGNKNATVNTNSEVLERFGNQIGKAQIINSKIIEPCYIADCVTIENSIIGPHVSIENNTDIKNSVIQNSIVYSNAKVSNTVINNSMIGNFSIVDSKINELSISDYTTLSI